MWALVSSVCNAATGRCPLDLKELVLFKLFIELTIDWRPGLHTATRRMVVKR